MKPLLFLLVSVLVAVNSNAQDFLQEKKRIDSIINETEKNIKVIIQVLEKYSSLVEGRLESGGVVYKYLADDKKNL